MRGVAKLAGAAIGLAVVCSAGSAWADFSACDGGLRADTPEQKIKLYTLCIDKGGLPIVERAGAYNNRGNAYEQLGDVDKALQDFSWAIESDPNWPTSYLNRGGIYQSRGEWAKARADLDKAVQVGNANTAGIARHLFNADAWLLATCPDPAVRDGPRAVKMAQRAVGVEETAKTRDTLAAAYAEAGQFEDAVREETKAIALAEAKQPEPEIGSFQARLQLYQHGMPFHRPPRP